MVNLTYCCSGRAQGRKSYLIWRVQKFKFQNNFHNLQFILLRRLSLTRELVEFGGPFGVLLVLAFKAAEAVVVLEEVFWLFLAIAAVSKLRCLLRVSCVCAGVCGVFRGLRTLGVTTTSGVAGLFLGCLWLLGRSSLFSASLSSC